MTEKITKADEARWREGYALEHEDKWRLLDALAAARQMAEAAQQVVWFDWSENDPDAVQSINRLSSWLDAFTARVAMED